MLLSSKRHQSLGTPVNDCPDDCACVMCSSQGGQVWLTGLTWLTVSLFPRCTLESPVRFPEPACLLSMVPSCISWAVSPQKSRCTHCESRLSKMDAPPTFLGFLAIKIQVRFCHLGLDLTVASKKALWEPPRRIYFGSTSGGRGTPHGGTSVRAPGIPGTGAEGGRPCCGAVPGCAWVFSQAMWPPILTLVPLQILWATSHTLNKFLFCLNQTACKKYMQQRKRVHIQNTHLLWSRLETP